jgi:hypothetical protein
MPLVKAGRDFNTVPAVPRRTVPAPRPWQASCAKFVTSGEIGPTTILRD